MRRHMFIIRESCKCKPRFAHQEGCRGRVVRHGRLRRHLRQGLGARGAGRSSGGLGGEQRLHGQRWGEAGIVKGIAQSVVKQHCEKRPAGTWSTWALSSCRT